MEGIKWREKKFVMSLGITLKNPSSEKAKELLKLRRCNIKLKVLSVVTI